ncbi:Related to neomycin resistance protein NEO1 [Taphrina deformans PYCC 5710]|uniref:Phospholipid-transporting ATPase n=1 Tax=Taphrina deformans (strain PYCC 5710 / ATCC 11124 / CBS 356.35 / IMI 108563 / JCM 9778 / NBRC 8474) TaxID=1097556 RepID=R4XFL9_TAPDE|nr:Related to neomycin resistance protein NEO1 [Taphrina deformans PYCC 5710]|eukprot:CCG82142.1 Related to neomycin resistance protein NEO1 [Taphrina deformans PYCC 5710]
MRKAAAKYYLMHNRSTSQSVALQRYGQSQDASDLDELDNLLDDSESRDSSKKHATGTRKRPFLWRQYFRRSEHCLQPRNIVLGNGNKQSLSYPSNAISNAKYNAFNFIPLVLFEQFKFFFNLYFLLVALSQIIPSLRIGFLSTYIAPLAFVLLVTMLQEAADDLTRRKRDSDANAEHYDVVGRAVMTKAKDIKVGDLIKVHKDRRIPADLVLLRTEEDDGEAFIRTDQLDGETDWKLKTACSYTQNLVNETDLLGQDGFVIADPPAKSMHEFTGTINIKARNTLTFPLSADNVLWGNTVLASGTTIIGLVVYTGVDTRQSLNTSAARAKAGLLEQEINNLSKILCGLTLLLSVALVSFHGFSQTWYIDVTRFLILFSTIIPISLRVNLDLGKNVYAHQIEHDIDIPETIVRTSTIPEELGRIEYLLSDKTGTLTKNDMELKKLHVGTVSFTREAMSEVSEYVHAVTSKSNNAPRTKREISGRVRDLVMALAVCHNVTPTADLDDEESHSYQAASPDELAIVKWTERVGLALIARDRKTMKLKRSDHETNTLEILSIFPFTSETKRMGILVRDDAGVITFYEKGADVVMAGIVAANDWLEEECGNMAREGLRTLVIGKKVLSKIAYERFQKEYESASVSMTGRERLMADVVAQHLEHNLELLGLTGVEDKLQDSVKPALEFLRNAGIKIWMLTGDKVETAKCIAISAKLVKRGQYIHTVTKLVDDRIAMAELEFLQNKTESALVIDGESLQYYLDKFQQPFVELTTQLPTVICCRCTPTQKADVARLIRAHTKRRVACIGDGGNDVSMIQAADIGVGIVGKEGKQASLAADFSVPEFRYLMKLLVWHGRNSYKRSAKLAQFVIHRGLIISICQIVFSVTSKFAPIALFQGWLMVGYATLYTMMPVFSLALDKDLDDSLALLYPELYKELTEGKSLSYKTFFGWVAISVYQGIAIMFVTLILHNDHDSKMVAISFTALIINELIMVALEVNTWVPLMIYAQVATILLYIATVPFLGDYFDLAYMKTAGFYWRTAIVTAISVGPTWAVKSIRRRLRPPDYAKLAGTA